MVPSSGVRFLTNGLKDSLSSDSITTSIYQSYDDPLLRYDDNNFEMNCISKSLFCDL